MPRACHAHATCMPCTYMPRACHAHAVMHVPRTRHTPLQASGCRQQCSRKPTRYAGSAALSTSWPGYCSSSTGRRATARHSPSSRSAMHLVYLHPFSCTHVAAPRGCTPWLHLPPVLAMQADGSVTSRELSDFSFAQAQVNMHMGKKVPFAPGASPSPSPSPNASPSPSPSPSPNPNLGALRPRGMHGRWAARPSARAEEWRCRHLACQRTRTQRRAR